MNTLKETHGILKLILDCNHKFYSKTCSNASPLDDLSMYAIAGTAIGTVAGFVGGVIASLAHGDSAYMLMGAGIGAVVGMALGFFGAESVAEGEYQLKVNRLKELEDVL